MFVLQATHRQLPHLIGAVQLQLQRKELPLETCLKEGLNWCPELSSRWAMGVMMSGFVQASNVGPTDDPTATGPTDIPWQSMGHANEHWTFGLRLFSFAQSVHSFEQFLMHLTSEDTLTILYDPTVDAIKVQAGMLASCDDAQVMQACRKQVDLSMTGVPPTIEAYLRSPKADPKSALYQLPSVALSHADRLEMLERAKILFIPQPWFHEHLEWHGYLTARVQRPRWYHFWADAFKIDNPLETYVVEGILEKKENTWRVYPKCDPGLVSFWKSHDRLWNAVSEIRPISLLANERFPCSAFPAGDTLGVAQLRLVNPRLLPLDHICGSAAVGVRVSPTFGTGGIFVIPNLDGGLVRGEMGDFPRPGQAVMAQLLGLSKAGKDDFWVKAAKKVALLATTYEPDLLSAMGPPRIRMWPTRKTKLADTREQVAINMAERQKFDNVPQAWQVVQSAGFDQKIPELSLWDPGAKWLANTLCMITAMRHLRAATLFESTFTTDLYDPDKLAQALLTAPATDFHAIWLCRVLGGSQEVITQMKQEIKGGTLTETADAIFG